MAGGSPCVVLYQELELESGIGALTLTWCRSCSPPSWCYNLECLGAKPAGLAWVAGALQGCLTSAKTDKDPEKIIQ